jgi:hypothetical protein
VNVLKPNKQTTIATLLQQRCSQREIERVTAYSTPSRTPFHSDGGQHSAVMADTVPR